jgi:hypothetical protein
MNYPDGQEAMLGDRVKLGDDTGGVVVCSLDRGEFTEDYPRDAWDHLESGILIEFPKWGLIHYTVAEDDLVLLGRAEAYR